MKTIVMALRVSVALLYTLIQMALLSLDSIVNGKSVERGFKHRRTWARNCLKILGVKVDYVEGQLPPEGGLIISNHRSLIDPVIQLAFMDTYIIAKAEVSKLPIISSGAKMTGIVFVQRERLRSRVDARNKTEELLLSGKNVLVYAEGTTGTEQTTSSFKPGTFAIAANHNIPVIPVSIEYPDRKDYWYDKGMRAKLVEQIGAWSTHVKLTISPPIRSDNATALIEKTKGVIDENLREMQKGWSKIFN